MKIFKKTVLNEKRDENIKNPQEVFLRVFCVSGLLFCMVERRGREGARERGSEARWLTEYESARRSRPATPTPPPTTARRLSPPRVPEGEECERMINCGLSGSLKLQTVLDFFTALD